ncbi:ArnT family glycosyltransferase [Singulisphaera acidiphila]|uniref:PMT family glycosyltransferase, 4-amino-4-deoxy-L-arabinose transferase n=1 Tax=Singulisphaera acidiphila (strain ATCC BAA-1392 / DSM 18658 / VKM B-2454 / MOB10) TaxID=886293 RepID=L0DNM6_SINAD|nr:glycosyltransferase family 39 protein [Singulisphaera acidiphila]AGA30415.1 PMT family glycosyltransferase, 4-amino-4-deoxy-L-arabinose transferase [Singulisphaera acidiphila DSM 18658]
MDPNITMPNPDSAGSCDPLPPGPAPRWCIVVVVLAGLLGLGLLADSIAASSASYDEVAYLKVAARWWRTGEQDEISRMGSPLVFWKLQQAPLLWILDHSGHRNWVDDPLEFQSRLLPLARLSSLWIWAVAWSLTVVWSRLLYGPRAMALAALLFVLSPNLLAHGALITMEMPLTACTTGLFLLFWRFLQAGDRRAFWGAAALAGLAMSCKYTTVIIPPMLGLIWWVDRWRSGERQPVRLTFEVARGMSGFLVVMGLANLIVTGFAVLPLGLPQAEHRTLKQVVGATLRPWVDPAMQLPIPEELVGFANQLVRQREGGPSYLFGERRMTGWWYYYFVALAVKVPLTVGLLFLGRGLLLRRSLAANNHSWMLPTIIALFMAITAAGSSRNYGLRYLLPLAPLAIVWVSGLLEGSRRARTLAVIGVLGQAVAVFGIHPHELTYFNAIAGGPTGGRRILADSNLDWGQGLKSLVRLQRAEPALADMTLYYFGDTAPRHYGVAGTHYLISAVSVPENLPAKLSAGTEFLAVSASLQWGPWGPDDYFQELRGLTPVRMTDDQTIAIYRARDLPEASSVSH